MSFSHYGTLCTEVYDLTKPVGHSLGGDIEYYLERLRGCQGRVLEAMVGSGRVLIPLLEAGIAVDGIDESPVMLASCRSRIEDRGLIAELYEGRLQHMDLPDRYEAIVIPAGSFLLIASREESIQALERLYEHLIPGGRLMLDLFLPGPPLEVGKTTTSTFTNVVGDTITLEGKLVEVDFIEQIRVSYLKYEKWREGRLVDTELQRMALRWYGIEEFRAILEKVGFTDVTVHADFQYGKGPERGSRSFVFEAVR
ncbi:class I SAM-dependent methyltransferase [Paenibacillus mesophilus]|uniref:class I SAM-dependent methyltransferase n=1 Tax=Paenibacillus mesophilus TaxID=2582849 RepID=UPI00110EA0CC|nr:class I SAM-dependent methyltransferase [Paenibacillus mesophilus]TMV47589.1 class I SAM-dependent methyltransferase [Paenibacillus mesophilus]